MSPMQRSLALYRERGWEPWPVERYIHQARVSRDFFEIGDLIALPPTEHEKPHLTQTTSASNYAARQAKILACPYLPLLLLHFRVVLHGWGKQKVKRGGKAVRFVLREAEFTANDLEYVEWPEVADA